MSKPDIDPKQTASGISVDPRTLDRVIPASSRPDGSVRKERKVRPGFTPQEDVSRFRGTRQQEADRNAMPKGHILGWVAPSSATKKASTTANNVNGVSKSALKNLKRKQKKEKEKSKIIRETWEQSDEEQVPSAQTKTEEIEPLNTTSLQSDQKEERSQGQPESAASCSTSENTGIPVLESTTSPSNVDALAAEVQKKLDVH